MATAALCILFWENSSGKSYSNRHTHTHTQHYQIHPIRRISIHFISLHCMCLSVCIRKWSVKANNDHHGFMGILSSVHFPWSEKIIRSISENPARGILASCHCRLSAGLNNVKSRRKRWIDRERREEWARERERGVGEIKKEKERKKHSSFSTSQHFCIIPMNFESGCVELLS